MFSGLMIHQVEPGTEIEHDGEKLTVTDTQAVHRGRDVYVTPKQYAALKANSDVRTGDTHD